MELRQNRLSALRHRECVPADTGFGNVHFPHTHIHTCTRYLCLSEAPMEPPKKSHRKLCFRENSAFAVSVMSLKIYGSYVQMLRLVKTGQGYREHFCTFLVAFL